MLPKNIMDAIDRMNLEDMSELRAALMDAPVVSVRSLLHEAFDQDEQDHLLYYSMLSDLGINMISLASETPVGFHDFIAKRIAVLVWKFHLKVEDYPQIKTACGGKIPRFVEILNFTAGSADNYEEGG